MLHYVFYFVFGMLGGILGGLIVVLVRYLIQQRRIKNSYNTKFVESISEERWNTICKAFGTNFNETENV